MMNQWWMRRVVRPVVLGWRRSWQWLSGSALLATATALLLVACQTSAVSANGEVRVDADFEAKVLEVIRKNPEAILNSVTEYNRQQAANRQQARVDFVNLVKTDPKAAIAGSPVTGAPVGNSVVLIEFSDFECPFCRRAQGPLKQFAQEYGDRVTFTFKHFPLTNIHDEALPAAYASWAAQQQGKFWEYHDALFENQNRLGEALYTEIAQTLNLDLGRFNRDRQGDAAQKAIQADLDLATTLNLQGTPTFLMNGEPLDGPPSLDAFKGAYERARGN
ncbi:MAG: thioredoxin domain-containing protein [Cyanobacteria bacterium]|nr:thioredoxin domain-containing protein [Cyanobacteriota bacterium]